MIRSLFLILMVVILLQMPAHGGEGWLINGTERAENGVNIKTEAGFGAQLWLIEPNDFFEKWGTPEVPKLEVTKRAKRNIPISTVLLFINPGVNSEGKSDVVYDMLIKKPNGGIYAEFKELKVWQDTLPPSEDAIQLAVDNIGIGIENEDPLGLYTVDVIVRDRVKKIEISLHQEFTAAE